jgi:hypothetical protein
LLLGGWTPLSTATTVPLRLPLSDLASSFLGLGQRVDGAGEDRHPRLAIAAPCRCIQLEDPFPLLVLRHALAGVHRCSKLLDQGAGDFDVTLAVGLPGFGLAVVGPYRES